MSFPILCGQSADHLFVAPAQEEGLPLLSADAVFQQYAVDLLG